MQYLTLAPDYTGSCIRDDFNGPIDINILSLPQQFIEELNSWHLAYRKIIPLTSEERELYKNEIDRLDIKGLQLARTLQLLMPSGTKVRYFSEGKFDYLAP